MEKKYTDLLIGKVLCSSCLASGVCKDSNEKVVLCSEYLSFTQ